MHELLILLQVAYHFEYVLELRSFVEAECVCCGVIRVAVWIIMKKRLVMFVQVMVIISDVFRIAEAKVISLLLNECRLCKEFLHCPVGPRSCSQPRAECEHDDFICLYPTCSVWHICVPLFHRVLRLSSVFPCVIRSYPEIFSLVRSDYGAV